MDTDASVEDILGRETWHEERRALRAIMCRTELEERVRWAKLTYAWNGSNVAIIQGFKDKLALAFFKGTLLDDPDRRLQSQGANSHSMMRLEFTEVAEIEKAEGAIRALVEQAIAVEEKGLEVPKSPADLPDPPEELLAAFEDDPALEDAFGSLTPGRQRGYLLHFGEAKQPGTRVDRIARHRGRIMAGKGLHDR